MLIKGLVKNSFVDYPGKIACVIFLGGCNFKCGFCYNKDLVVDIDAGDILDEEEIFNFLSSRRDVLDGIVVTGGETTVSGDLVGFMCRLKEFGLPIKLDTNGTNPEMLKKLLAAKLIDYVAMDIKAPLDEGYGRFVGALKDPVAKIMDSIEVLKGLDVDFEFRTTIIPSFHTKKVVGLMEKDLLDLVESHTLAFKWYLQPFIPGNCISDDYCKMKKCTNEYINDLVLQMNPALNVVARV